MHRNLGRTHYFERFFQAQGLIVPASNLERFLYLLDAPNTDPYR